MVQNPFYAPLVGCYTATFIEEPYTAQAKITCNVFRNVFRTMISYNTHTSNHCPELNHSSRSGNTGKGYDLKKVLKWIGIVLVGWTVNDTIAAAAVDQHLSGRILDEGIAAPRVRPKNWPQLLNITKLYPPHRRMNEQTLTVFAASPRDEADQEGLSARLLRMVSMMARPKRAAL